MTSTDPFVAVSDLLSEMQCELMRREWSDDMFKRINQAAAFRGKLFRAICAYRDEWMAITKGSAQ